MRNRKAGKAEAKAGESETTAGVNTSTQMLLLRHTCAEKEMVSEKAHDGGRQGDDRRVE